MEAQRNHADLGAELTQEAEVLRAADRALVERLDREERQAARIDARGIILIGLGVVMTGVPDGLAAPGWLGWFLVAVAAALVLWLGLWPVGRGVARALAPGTPSS
jgi:fatty acid desaturase